MKQHRSGTGIGMQRHTTFVLLFALAGASLASGENPPLHHQIDQLVAAKTNGPTAPPADDAEFLRRVSLDLAGTIPTADETRRFLADDAPDKRAALIDRLLSAPEYTDRMTDQFHVMLMEQRGDNAAWETFLRDCFQHNRPWDEIVHDILLPARDDETRRGAAYFYTQRLAKVGQNPTDYPGLTRDVGRLFLGVDLQCAECHDHLFIDDYRQQEFQGLLAVYQNVSIRQEDFPAVNETTMAAKLEFASVFTDEMQQTGPRVPFGEEFAIPEPPAEDPAAQKKRPDPNDPPTFSALARIAESLPSAENHLFRQNIANRIWFLLMGEGLVEPLDQFHSANPPTHPELLDLLADEIASHDFDIKWLMREILLTETWQRSSRWPDDAELPADSTVRWRRAEQRSLTPDQMLLSTLQATGNLARLRPQDAAEPTAEFTALQKKFDAAFALEPKEPALGYRPSVKQALFLANDSDLLGLLQPQPGNLLQRLSELPDDDVPDELYLSLFTRFPDADERTFINDYLEEHNASRNAALRQLAWGMLTSMEFCLNH